MEEEKMKKIETSAAPAAIGPILRESRSETLYIAPDRFR